MFYPTFPADRHVKAWLKENNLPTKPHVIVELFKELRKNPSGYSRAIFDAKAENATFTVS